jgi:hypothetical protein
LKLQIKSWKINSTWYITETTNYMHKD